MQLRVVRGFKGGQGWSREVRNGQAWSRIVNDGQGWSKMVKDVKKNSCQGC